MAETNVEEKPLKVYLLCTGVNVWRGGIETFFRECFDGIHGTPGLDLHLFKGRGAEAVDEHRVWCLPRDRFAARFLGTCIRRNAYVVEQLSSFLPLARRIRQGKPDILFSSDSNLLRRLAQFRKWVGVPYRIIYSNGAPLHPPFTTSVDHVQQVVPAYYHEAIRFGEPPQKHSMVPYGINVPQGDPDRDPALRMALRRALNLPEDRPIIISVGWVSATHKRMDHIVREVAGLTSPWPYLVMLGRTDQSTNQVITLADSLLGRTNYAVRSVPYEQVRQFYTASDIFTLGSLVEGFGRVYLEALMEGLPCIAHDTDVTRYVLGEEGTYVDMAKPGALTAKLAELLPIPQGPEDASRRRAMIRRRFSWPVLAPAYREMFHACMRNTT